MFRSSLVIVCALLLPFRSESADLGHFAATVCSHALLKASTGQTEPFVVLNLAHDWR